MSNTPPEILEVVALSPEQTEMVKDAIKSLSAGEPTFSAAEVLQHARERVQEWLPSLSA
ncbi:MAG: hypothetical protein WCK51_14140 [Armatimonadota bacterium]